MQRLEGLDSSFVYLDTPAAPMQVAMTCVFDPHTAPGDFSFAAVRRRVDERLHLVPPFRRRLVSVPGHLHRPVWIEDPDFDLDHHVRPAVLRPPGGTAELAEFAAEAVRRAPQPLQRPAHLTPQRGIHPS